MSRSRLPSLVLALLLLGPGPARSEALIAIGDPGYGLAPSADQARPVPPQVRQIAYPTVAMPALVEPAQRFSVLLRVDCQPDLGRLEAWAQLVRAPIDPLALEVLGLTTGDAGTGRLRLHLRVPAGTATDHYDLVLDDGACLRDRQPSALRVHRAGTGFRFAVVADEQLGDPTGLLSGGPQNGDLYPDRGLADLAARRRLQLREELELLDPLFVLYPGDLCFGMDYPAEYGAVRERLASARLAVFAVPGNHDGYAVHRVVAQPGWHRQVHRAAFCVGSFTPTSPLDGVAAVGGCVLQRLDDVLDLRLETDGLQAWRGSLGPDSYAFSQGGVRFVGLNTYGGSVARRTAVPVSLGRLRDWVELDLLAEAGVDPLLGAPLVDNYGGFLAPESIAWVEAQARQAREAGEALVLFAHHDPTGIYLGEQAVREDEPFGEDPVSMGGFEVWNFDQAWDSDPKDGIGVESTVAHSGARLLRALGGDPATLVVGHSHYDDDRPVGDDPDAQLRIVQATTAGAGLAYDGAYRGYRLVEVDQGRVARAEHAPDLGWASLPIGNLWVEDRPRSDGPPDRVLVSGLPQAVQGRLRFTLPADPRGYRFVLEDGGEERELLADELTHSRDGLRAWVTVPVPAAQPLGPVAREAGELVRVTLRWELAEDNAPPVACIGLDGRRSPREGAPLRVRSGQAIHLSSAASQDDGPLLSATWTVGGQGVEGFDPQLVLERPGRYPVTLRVVDLQGAVGRAEAELVVRGRPPWWPLTRSSHAAR